jgi:RNA polymerase sigma-70 factor (ECF subfamily)
MSSRISRIAFDPPALGAEAIAESCVAGSRAAEPEWDASLFGQLRQRFWSDEELAGAMKDGNADALAVIFKRHSALVFAITRRILGNDAEAEDAVQQVFLDVFRAIGQFDPEKGSLKTWLLMFAYHRTFNRRRALRASRYFDTDSLDERGPELLCPDERTPKYSNAERRILVEQALRSLSPRQRRTIELVYFGGLTADEVSARTGETVRVVRHNLYRGLEKLRTLLCEPAAHTSGAAKGGRR